MFGCKQSDNHTSIDTLDPRGREPLPAAFDKFHRKNTAQHLIGILGLFVLVEQGYYRIHVSQPDVVDFRRDFVEKI